MTTRTDIHRPGAIVPGNYRYVLSYSLTSHWNGEVIEGINVKETRELMANKLFAKTGTLGKCSVCSALYTYGDIWMHQPTGEHIHIGHDCADKYEMMADRSAFELELGNLRDAAAKIIKTRMNEEERSKFLAKHPGLEEALKTDHQIVRDIADKFKTYRSLSEKQVALVFKLETESKLPPPPIERFVKAPEGRVSFKGIVVGAKFHDGYGYGNPIPKITVKVETSEGNWMAWGTLPAALLQDDIRALVGKTLEITATLTPGRDAHFTFMKRPSAKLV